MKTLHPGVHGGILAIRDNKEHMGALAKHGISTIDLVRGWVDGWQGGVGVVLGAKRQQHRN